LRVAFSHRCNAGAGRLHEGGCPGECRKVGYPLGLGARVHHVSQIDGDGSYAEKDGNPYRHERGDRSPFIPNPP
jgi:hypothetical protein